MGSPKGPRYLKYNVYPGEIERLPALLDFYYRDTENNSKLYPELWNSYELLKEGASWEELSPEHRFYFWDLLHTCN